LSKLMRVSQVCAVSRLFSIKASAWSRTGLGCSSSDEIRMACSSFAGSVILLAVTSGWDSKRGERRQCKQAKARRTSTRVQALACFDTQASGGSTRQNTNTHRRRKTTKKRRGQLRASQARRNGWSGNVHVSLARCRYLAAGVSLPPADRSTSVQTDSLAAGRKHWYKLQLALVVAANAQLSQACRLLGTGIIPVKHLKYQRGT
jgi:hypothetical protein